MGYFLHSNHSGGAIEVSEGQFEKVNIYVYSVCVCTRLLVINLIVIHLNKLNSQLRWKQEFCCQAPWDMFGVHGFSPFMSNVTFAPGN